MKHKRIHSLHFDKRSITIPVHLQFQYGYCYTLDIRYRQD